ncbi:DUF4440 domain-containing protein [Methylobacterium sp. JK268]
MSDDQDHGWARRGVLLGLGLAAMPGLAAAETGADEAVGAAVERLRVAIQAGDAATLDALTHPQLSYGHSSGRKVQTKDAFIASLAGRVNYKSLAFSEQVVQIVGSNALVRHVWDGADILPNGEIGRSFIAVLQVWVKEPAGWQLLARQSCPLKPA